MADSYIDYFEVGEYGGHFVKESQKLVGSSSLVNVEALRERVGSAVAQVDTELEKAGIKRSDLRSGRTDTSASAEAARREIDRFWSHLRSLDDDVAVDLGAFFPGEKLGALAALKPEDVKSKVSQVLRGFSAPINAALPERAKWEGKLRAASEALDAALGDKGNAKTVAIQSTAGLIAAREDFLRAYNGVAKRLIQGLLVELGREDEMRLFFKDLQVNERSPAKKAPAETPKPPETPPVG